MAKLMYAIGQKKRVNIGEFIFDYLAGLASPSYLKRKKSFGNPSLIYEMIMNQAPEIKLATERPYGELQKLFADIKLFQGGRVVDTIRLDASKGEGKAESLSAAVESAGSIPRNLAGQVIQYLERKYAEAKREHAEATRKQAEAISEENMLAKLLSGIKYPVHEVAEDEDMNEEALNECGLYDLNGSPKSKTTISSSETPFADTLERKTIDSVTEDKTNVPVDENMENDAREVATPEIKEATEEIGPNAGKSLVADATMDNANVLVDENMENAAREILLEEGNKMRTRGKGKATLQKLAAQAVVEGEGPNAGKLLEQEGVLSEEGNKMRTQGQGKATLQKLAAQAIVKGKEKTKEGTKKRGRDKESKEHGVELVGSRIKVWWPEDKK